MKILLASSEVHPYSKTGGLADMVGALAKALAHAGHQVGLVTPLYRGIRERFPTIHKMDWHLELPLGLRQVFGEIWKEETIPGLTTYFVHQPDFYFRNDLYQDSGISFADNAARYIFFSKAVVHLARYLPWQPEIVHCHDWQTGLVPLLIQHQRLQQGWAKVPRSCFTIHNLAYQGVFPAADYALTNLPPDYFNLNGAEFYGGLNCMKAAITFADVLTTVSPRYAREITTPEWGCSLDDRLRQRQDSLFGILNGVDYEEWNSAADPFLQCTYSVTDLTGKAQNKIALQKELGLPVSADTPLFGCITRLADQKGLDIQLAALEEMLSADMQFVLLGSGAVAFEKGYQQLASRHPGKVAIRIGFNQGLSHRIEAGCDFYLMPSRFEPCGLNQMYSLRYGTIPIVRITGGLDDTVVDVTEDKKRANGIKFAEYSARALAWSIRKALTLYGDGAALRFYQRNGMNADFSWVRMVKRYEAAYQFHR